MEDECNNGCICETDYNSDGNTVCETSIFYDCYYSILKDYITNSIAPPMKLKLFQIDDHC